jgi:hypothetical protein
MGVAPQPTAPSTGVLEERRDSPGLLLALLGQSAMRRLREVRTANGLSPRQFHLLALLHDRGPTGQGELGQKSGARLPASSFTSALGTEPPRTVTPVDSRHPDYS